MLATATLGAALVLGGCGGGESHEPSSLDMEEKDKSEQKDDKKAQESPTPTPSETGPQEVPSVKPETDSKKRQQAAEDFLRSYIDEVNRSGKTGEFSKLNAMVADTCEICKYALETEDLYDKGHSLKGGEWKITDIDYKATFKGVLTFEVKLDIAAAKEVDQNGEGVKKYKSGTAKNSYAVSDKSGKWQVVGGDDLSES